MFGLTKSKQQVEATQEVLLSDLLEEQPFRAFGTWTGEPTAIAKRRVDFRISQWLAANRRVAVDASERWQRCIEANPKCFDKFHVVDLAEKSLFLRRGKRVFEVRELPREIPDNPPRGILLRLAEAKATFPEATFWFLEPIFLAESGELYSADALEEEALADMEANLSNAWLWGVPLRSIDRTVRAIHGVGRCLTYLRLGMELVGSKIQDIEFQKWSQQQLAKALQRQELLEADLPEVLESVSSITDVSTRRDAFLSLLERKKEETRISNALREAERRIYRMMTGRDATAIEKASLGEALQTVPGETEEERYRRLEEVIKANPHIRPLDPIIAFTLPDEPNVLRFVGHWFWDPEDGKLCFHV